MAGEAKRRRKHAAKYIKFGMHRLVILEWLARGPKDLQTGSELKAALDQIAPSLPVTCVRCDSAADVLARIQELTDNALRTGDVPVLQIDAHGYNEAGAKGITGTGPDGITERISWDVLGEALRRLNLATHFNLMFVGAACWSDNAIYAVTNQGIRPLPFILAVGFPEEVDQHHAFAAMLCLYVAMLVENLGLQQSFNKVEALLSPFGVKLSYFSIPKIIRNAFLDASRSISNPANNHGLYLKEICDAAVVGRRPDSPQQFQNRYAATARGAIDRMLSELLAYTLIPENKERFRYDGRKLIQEAARQRSCN